MFSRSLSYLFSAPQEISLLVALIAATVTISLWLILCRLAKQ